MGVVLKCLICYDSWCFIHANVNVVDEA